MQKRSENFWKPAQSFANLILAEQRENLEALRKQIVDVQDRVKAFSNETQAKPEINGELVAIKGQIAEVRRMVENLQQTISRSDPEKQIVALQKQLAEMKKMFVNLQDKRGE
jgi:predicted  nucleic acid-binding Zn-ribbon protein